MKSGPPLIFAFFCLAVAAQAGVVTLRDGTVLQGDATLTDKGVSIRLTDGKTRDIPVDALRQVDVDAKAPPPDKKPNRAAAQAREEGWPVLWSQQTLSSKKKVALPGSATFNANEFTLSMAGGQITEGDDAMHLVHQEITGDFTLTAKLVSLTGAEMQTGGLAGIIIRESLDEKSKIAALVCGGSVLHFARRPESWARTVISTEADKPAPQWLRLVRHGSRIRAYLSGDGGDWKLVAADKITLPDKVVVGMCVMSRNREKSATGVFEQVKITLGGPEMKHPLGGVVYKSGSFVPADVPGMKNDKLHITRDGKATVIGMNEISRIIYQPVSAEIIQSVPEDRTGVLLAGGDFVEGEIKEIGWRISVSNVLFGLRHVPSKGGEALAVYLGPNDAAAAKVVVHAADGAVYHCREVRLGNKALTLDDASLGVIELPVNAVRKLDYR